jgi:hypothetical protein
MHPARKFANRPATTTSDSQPQMMLSATSARMARLPILHRQGIDRA